MAQAPKAPAEPRKAPSKPSAQDIADRFDSATSATIFLDTELDDATRKTLLDEFQLFAELDAPRGVDSVREATDEELATLEQPAAKPAPSAAPAARPD